MNSFTLTAIGNVARTPELIEKNGSTFTRFCLVGNDYAGKDDEGATREVVTSLWFVAFGVLGEAIARNARKGDQLIHRCPRSIQQLDRQAGREAVRPLLHRPEL